jgi:hypothetical protein
MECANDVAIRVRSSWGAIMQEDLEIFFEYLNKKCEKAVEDKAAGCCKEE